MLKVTFAVAACCGTIRRMGTTGGRGSSEGVTVSNPLAASRSIPPWTPPPTPPYGTPLPGHPADGGRRRTVLIAAGLAAVLASAGGGVAYLSERTASSGAGEASINAAAGVIPLAGSRAAASGGSARSAAGSGGSVGAGPSGSLSVDPGATSGAVDGTLTAGTPVAGGAVSGGSVSGGSVPGAIVPGAAAVGAPKSVVIASDLPLQGATRYVSLETNRALALYLQRIGNKVGPYKVTLRTYDNSTAARGAWDEATCLANAQQHLAHPDEVAIIGPYNSGCAKIEVPVLNSAPSGAAPLMISHANSNPGLTVAWDAGEPAKYYPSGARNYARVVPTDDHQATAAALYAARTLKVRRCAVLDDTMTYGQGLAKAFIAQAKRSKITVLEHDPWDPKATSYRSLFLKLKAEKVDCLYLGGVADSNGAQLIKDKVAVLGSNAVVPVLAGDGFSGYPQIDALPAAAGMYVTFPGVDAATVLKRSAAARAFAAAYAKKYGKIRSAYTYYALAALQVVLAALKGSNGTAAGIRVKVLSGAGVSLGAKQNVLGSALAINPATGDVRSAEISVLRIQGGRESVLTRLIAP